MVHEHLRQHLLPPPAAVVDVGGGAGDQSVTIVDPSPEMRLSRLFLLVGRRPG